jgi:hypothetical protein
MDDVSGKTHDTFHQLLFGIGGGLQHHHIPSFVLGIDPLYKHNVFGGEGWVEGWRHGHTIYGTEGGK